MIELMTNILGVFCLALFGYMVGTQDEPYAKSLKNIDIIIVWLALIIIGTLLIELF